MTHDASTSLPSRGKYSIIELFLFTAIIEQAGLRQIDLNERQYTRGNNLQNPTFEKLARVLCCPGWEENYPTTDVSALVREKFDHTPSFSRLYCCAEN